MLVRPAESRCAIAAQLAIWVRTRSAYTVPDERRGLEELDGVIGVKGWHIDEEKAACILITLKTALLWIGIRTGNGVLGGTRIPITTLISDRTIPKISFPVQPFFHCLLSSDFQRPLA
jgi:hypothetical protein